MKNSIYRVLAVLLAFALAGATEVAQACQATTQNQSQTTDQNQQPAQAQQQAQPQTQPQSGAPAQDTTTAAPAKENNASDPTHVPSPGEVLPNAPSASQDAQTNPTPTPPATPAQAKDQQPLGTAAAEKGQTTGGAASKPAGTAIAGRKQNQSRGILIKVGAVLAAGAALGTVYALSRSTTPVPPGAAR